MNLSSSPSSIKVKREKKSLNGTLICKIQKRKGFQRETELKNPFHKKEEKKKS
jgi:hypothetical protein